MASSNNNWFSYVELFEVLDLSFHIVYIIVLLFWQALPGKALNPIHQFQNAQEWKHYQNYKSWRSFTPSVHNRSDKYMQI